jgi:hypothetical protein
MHDLIEAFSEEDIMVCEIKVIMVDSRGNDEIGLDLRGIYRDAISCFWQEFTTRVPSASEKGFQPLGMISSKMNGPQLHAFSSKDFWIWVIFQLC